MHRVDGSLALVRQRQRVEDIWYEHVHGVRVVRTSDAWWSRAKFWSGLIRANEVPVTGGVKLPFTKYHGL